MKFSHSISSVFITAASFALLNSSCASDEPDKDGNDNNTPAEFAAEETVIVKTTNDFSRDFYNLTVEMTGNDNFMVSPLSLSMALSMVSTGAAGATQSEILGALGFRDKDMNAVNALNKRLAAELVKVDPSIALSLANSIWFDESLSLNPSFIETNRNLYDAEFYNYVNGSASSMNDMNSWASSKTNGLIKDFITAPVQERMIILNAIYFKGIWNEPFKKASTNKEIFYSADGSARQVDMMHNKQLECGAMHDDEGATWLHLGYGKNNLFEMVLVLPDSKEADALERYMATVSAETFAENIAATWSCTADVSLPKFEIDSDFNLCDILSGMGVKSAFSNSADFSNISSSQLKIKTVKQRTIIKVDEEGTEAAGVSGAEMDSVTAPEQVEVSKFVFDRPFAFFVREKSSNVILFTGRVSKL